MDDLGAKFKKLRKQKIIEKEVKIYLELLPFEDKVSKVKEKNADFLYLTLQHVQSPLERQQAKIRIY